MRYIFVLLIFISLLSFRSSPSKLRSDRFSVQQDSLYKIAVSTIDDAPVNLQEFHGKRILIVLLPLVALDSSVTSSELDAIQARYGDSLVIVGVLAEEMGYNLSVRQHVKELWTNHSGNFILLEGMKTKKSSGNQQSRLFQWLTDKNRNGYFDQEVGGTGTKFFINQNGGLYAVIGPHFKLSSSVVEKIIDKGR
jgi:glutathione peroxidase